MVSVAEVEAAFTPEGKLSRNLASFAPRPAQTKMALCVAEALNLQQVAFIEAATGTGKTFGYLLPVLLDGRQAVISTGTRALQEQLFHRDLPQIRDALGLPRTISLLKGRGNYLCLQRLDQHLKGGAKHFKQHWQKLYQVQQWATQTQSGDIGDIPTLSDDDTFWPLVTSTVDNCLGKHCPRLGECWVKHAREQAQQADIIVVNHHLFFADAALRDTGFGELLPEAEICIFDEAHQVPEVAADYFAERLSTRQLREICRQLQQLYLGELSHIRQLSVQADRLSHTVDELVLQFANLPRQGPWRQVKHQMLSALTRMQDELSMVREVCSAHQLHAPALQHLSERTSELLQVAGFFVSDNQHDSAGCNLWYQCSERHVALHRSPLSIANKLQQLRASRNGSWIFTSATLSVGSDFSVFGERLGLLPDQQVQLASPFDFANQAVLLVPRYLPLPERRDRIAVILEQLLPLLRDSQGNCMLLFTSHLALKQAALWLAQHWAGGILQQGQLSKQQLINRFVSEPRSLLLGLASFWEGVDLPGRALSCVIIDKLPFAPPDDPMLQARMQFAQAQGKSGFDQVLLPQSVLALKQGAGRLIRRQSDSGVLVIADPRLVTREYGQAFLSSLPPMRRTRNVDLARQFLRQLLAESAEKKQTNSFACTQHPSNSTDKPDQ